MANDRIGAAQELERLPDWGRGSIAPNARRLRSVGLWAGVTLVVAVPQALAAILGGGVLLQVELGVLFGTAPPAGYAVVTGALTPALPARSCRLWLFSKIAATTMTSIALASVLVAGPFGLIVAAPAAAVAAVSAAGTALLRRGILIGSILPITMFSLLGFGCVRQHFESPADNQAVRAVAFAAFCTATILALLTLVAVASPQPPGRDDQAKILR